MPSESKKQHNFMEAVAHSPEFAKKAGVPSSVGKDFAAADKGRAFEGGGQVAKRYMGKVESFAKGGEVLGRTRDFMKAPDRFRQQDTEGNFVAAPPVQKTSDDWGKDEKPNKVAITAPPARKNKSLPMKKPRGC